MRNPTSNRLPTGVTKGQVTDAIRRSGYPLQARVAALIRKLLLETNGRASVQEEWSYIDADTKELRAVDLIADMYLFPEGNWPTVRPVASALIECKQSELPYVFFATVAPPSPRNFPLCAGLGREHLQVATPDLSEVWPMLTLAALGVSVDPFVSKPPATCTSLSRCRRTGNKLDLSGSETYQSIVLPLLKASRHLAWQVNSHDADPESCHAVVPIAVLDAPMVVYTDSTKRGGTSLVPWIRLLRHETTESSPVPEHEAVYGVDFVHADFLEEYFRENLLPFADRFAASVLRHQDELKAGEGVIDFRDDMTWSEFESALHPRGGREHSPST